MRRLVGGMIALGLLAATSVAFAGGAPSSAPSPPDPNEKLELHWQTGPQEIALGKDAEIDLPEHYMFLPMPDADKLMRKLGNFYNDNLLGLVAGDSEDARWFVTVRSTEEGHVDDHEALKPAEILKAIQEGTEQANAEREKNGFAAAHVDGWTQEPRYERELHHLVWALVMRTKDGDSLNYSTRILGRKGFLALNLVTGPDRLAADMPNAEKLLAVTHFKPGSRYEDFDQKTDKVAEYGLMGLILGGVGLGALKVAKVGLLAAFFKPIVAVLLALKKAVILFFVAIGGWFKRTFGKKKEQPPVVASQTPPPPTSVAPPLSVEPKADDGSKPPTDDFK